MFYQCTLKGIRCGTPHIQHIFDVRRLFVAEVWESILGCRTGPRGTVLGNATDG